MQTKDKEVFLILTQSSSASLLKINCMLKAANLNEVLTGLSNCLNRTRCAIIKQNILPELSIHSSTIAINDR